MGPDQASEFVEFFAGPYHVGSVRCFRNMR